MQPVAFILEANNYTRGSVVHWLCNTLTCLGLRHARIFPWPVGTFGHIAESTLINLTSDFDGDSKFVLPSFKSLLPVMYQICLIKNKVSVRSYLLCPSFNCHSVPVQYS